MTNSRVSVANADPTASGEIKRGVAYTRRRFRLNMGWSESAVRAAKRRGLRLRRIGKQDIILGDDFIDWVASQNDGNR